MTKRLQKKIALVCAVCLLSLLFSGYAAMDDDLLIEESVTYEKIPVTVNGDLEYSGYLIDGTTYFPFRSFCGVLNMGAIVSWDRDNTRAVGLVQNYIITAGQDDPYVIVNGRCFYAPSGVVNYHGNLLIPLRILCDAFQIEVEWDHESEIVNLVTDDIQVCQSGDTFYDEDDLYWLSRIISAEARDQSVLGKVSVGNVVLNRVKSTSFPDTVYDVVFDSAYGVVQFDPVRTGTIYEEPDEESVIAAKLCLEGCDIAGESLYFVNPAIGSTSWFSQNRTFVTSIGDHDFYA